MPAEVRTNGITVTKVTTGFIGGLGFYSKDNRYTQPVHQQLPRPLRPRRDQARARRRRRDHLRRAQVRDAAVARSARSWRRAASPPATCVNALREQNVQVAAGALGDAPAPAEQLYTISVRADGPPVRSARSSRTSSSRPARTARWCASRTSAASSSAPKPTRRTCASSASKRRASASRCCRRPTRIEVFDGVVDRDEAAGAQLPAGARMAGRLRQRRRRARVDHRSAEDAGSRRSASSSS